MDQFAQGTQAYTEAVFRDDNGNLVDPADPRVDRFDPANTAVVVGAVPARLALGLYRYSALLASNAPLGIWRDRWTATGWAPGDEYFEVVLTLVTAPTLTTTWTTPADVLTRTGQVVTQAQIDAASMDIFRAIRWMPDPTVDLLGDGMREIMQRDALAEAISWQAAERAAAPPKAGTGPPVKAEKTLDWSVTYADPPVTHGGIVPRAAQALASSGLYRLLGTSNGRSRRSHFIDTEPIGPF